LVVRRNFVRILPNLPEKYLTTKKKEMLFMSIRAPCDLQIKLLKSIRAPLFLNKSMLGAIFAQIFSEFSRFSEICPDFMGFSPNQNFRGYGCTPFTPASYTSSLDSYEYSTASSALQCTAIICNCVSAQQ